MSNDFEARVVAKLDTSEFEKQMKNISGKHNIKLNVDSADGSKQIDSVNTSIQNAEKSSRSFGNTLKSALGIGSGAAVITKAFQAIQKAIRNAVDAVKDFDSAIKDLRMATGESYESVSELVSQYNALGKELGATTIEVTSSADAWLRQGHDIETTNELIRDSMILSKVANLDSAESTEYLTSAMKGYKVAAEDVIGIVDKLTAVDLVSATDAGGLVEAMSRTAVSADMAGVSMDKLLGYLAAVGEVTQKSMSSVGESFKTIFQRMSDIKTNKLELVDADGTTETLSDVEQSLKNVGIDLRETVNEYNNYGDVLDSLASKWDGLTQVQQNAITKAFAGVRQSENFRVLMENYSNAQAYMTTAMESAGTAEQKFESYLDSLEAKSKTLQASFESLATNTFSSDLLGGIMDASASMMEFLNKTNMVKGAIAGIGTFGAIKGISALAGGVKDAAINMNAFGLAMKLLKAGNLGEAEFEQLVQATKNLSDSQIEAVLSSKALSVGQRTAILTANGMSTAEAQATLASMGLATAEGTATTATFSLSGAMQGLWATLMANPLILVAAAVTATVSAYSIYKQHVEEARRASLEAGEAAKNEADKIRDLLTAYEEANTAYENNTGSKESLETATTDLLAALGVEQSQLETLIEKYGDLDTAIHAVTVDSLKKSLTELTSGYQAAIDELLDATDKIEARGRFGVLFSSNAEELENTFTDVLKEVGLISPFEVGVKGKYEIFLGNEGKTDSLENVIAVYEEIIKLQESLEKGVADGKYTREQLANSNLWQDLSNKLNSFKDKYADVFDYIKKINETAAKIQIMEWEKNNDIPETAKDIEAFKQQMISTAQSSGEFVGSQEDIQNAVINTIDSMYGFADAERQYADGAKKAAENTDDLANAFDMSSIKDFTGGLEKLQKVYADIADGGDFDFSNVIDEDFTETFGDLGDAYGAFMQTVAETPDDVNACKSAFQNLANAYLQNVGNLEDLDANTKAVTAAMLEQMGVSNAAEAVEESLVKQKVLAAAEDFRDMTVEETESIYALCQALAMEQSVLDKINRLKNVTQYLNDGIITTDADGHTWTESELANEKTKLENELRDFFKNNRIELDFDFSKLTKGAKASTDGLPEKYESDLKEIKRQLDMGEKTEAEYYEALEKLSNDYLTKDEKFVDELNSNRAAIRSFQQKSIEELYNATKKLVEQELQDQIDALDAETDAIKDSVAAQKEALEAASEAYNTSIEKKISAIDSEIDHLKAVADAAKKRVEAEKKAMQDSTKAQISAYNSQKDSIKKTADAEKKAAEDRYKAIEKEIKGKISLLEKEKKEYEKLADAKKKALQDEVDSEDYEYELSQKQSNLTELNRELASLQNNNSASAQKRKAELQDEIAAMQREIYTFQQDRNVDLAVESIQTDLEAKQTEYDNRVDTLNEELEKKKEAYDAEIEQIEAVRDAQIESIEAQIDALNNYMDMQEAAFDRRIEQIEAELAAKEEELNKKKAKLEEEKKAHEAATKAKEKLLEEYEKRQTQSLENQKKELEKNLNNQEYLHNATLKKIAEDNGTLYDELNEYNKKYGDGINNSIISMWNAATRAVKRYQIAATATGIADEVAKAVQGYASGTMHLPYSGMVQTDERGYEIKLNRKSGNNYEFMNSGSVILPNDFTSKIMAFVADPERYVQHVLPNGDSNIGSVVQENINNVVNNNPVEVKNETVNNYNITGDSPQDIARQIDKISKRNIDDAFEKINTTLRKNGMGRKISQIFSDQKGKNLVVCGGFEKAVSNAWDAYTYNPTQGKFNQADFDQVTTNNVVVLYDSLQQTPRISAPRQSNGTYAAAVQLYSGGDNENIADLMLCSKSPIRLESGQEYTFSCDLSFGETATDRVTSENKTLYVPIHVALMTKNALGLIKDGTIDFDELISYQACLELLSQERQYYCDYKYTLSNGFTAQLNGASNFFNNDLYLVFYFKFSDMGFVAPDSLSSMYAYFDKVSITSSAYTGGYYENGYNVLSAQSFSDYGIPSATVPLLSANGYDGGSMLTVSQNHDISSDMFRVFGSLPYYISAYVIGSGQINIRWYSSESPSSLIKTETLSFENIETWERISKKCIAPENACNVAVCLISNSATANYDGVLLEQSAFLNAYSDNISEQFSKYTKIDDSGIAVYNGAIKIYNNNGVPVFWGDQNGNLELVGNITASSGHIAGWEIQADRLSAIDNAGQISSAGEFISGNTENENDYYSKIQNGKYEMYETGQTNDTPRFVGGIYGDGSAFQTAVGKYSINRPFGILGQNGVIIAKKDGNSDDQVAVFSDNIFLNKDIASDIKISNGSLYLKTNNQTYEALSLYGSSLALGDSNHEVYVMSPKTLFLNDVGVMGSFKCNEPMYCQGQNGSIYRVVTEDVLTERYNELVAAINSIQANTANNTGNPTSGSQESSTPVRTVETYNSAQWDNLWVKMRSATNGSGDKYAYPGENGNPTSAIGFASGGRSNCYALAQWQYDNNRSPSYTYRRNPYSVSDPVNRNLYDNNTYNIWADEANASNLKRSYPTS